jgi:hypothetical protein
MCYIELSSELNQFKEVQEYMVAMAGGGLA